MKNFLVDRIGMYTVFTSGLTDKYFVGLSTCGGIGAKKVARILAEHFISGFHKRGYMTGYMGVKLGNEGIETKPADLERAYKMGNKLADDIRRKKKYLFQKLGDRVITTLIVRKMIIKNIYANKDGSMKAVYENLVDRDLIKPL